MNQTTEANHECEHFLMTDVAVYCCDCDNILIVDIKDGHTTEYVPKEHQEADSAAEKQERIILYVNTINDLKKVIVNNENIIADFSSKHTDLAKRILELEDLVNALHIGMVARGNYINSVTCIKVEVLKEKYKF